MKELIEKLKEQARPKNIYHTQTSISLNDLQTLLNAIEDRWVPCDKDNLPKGEVLAFGYQGEMLIGYLDQDAGGVFCESDSEILPSVTHYQTPKPPQI